MVRQKQKPAQGRAFFFFSILSSEYQTQPGLLPVLMNYKPF